MVKYREKEVRSAISTRDRAPEAPREIFPQVLSASRATDLPAFHADWLIKSLRRGSCEWQNPFNARQRQIVNFSNVRAIVFWSKNPSPLIPWLEEISDSGRQFYFQFTLNDYEKEGLEPGAPPLRERIKTFSNLARRCKVIWRYDPIVMGGRLSVGSQIQKVANLMKCLGDLAARLVFSFMDLYGRAGSSLARFNPEYRIPCIAEMREFTMRLIEQRDRIAPQLKLATCAEADLDYQAMGIEKNSCIDPRLVNEICASEVYRPRRSLLGDSYEKDKGQRRACCCAPSKDIGNYRGQPCGHGCRYCYAGHAKKDP